MTENHQPAGFNPNTDLPGDAVLRKPDIDCNFYYWQHDDSELLERAVIDTARVGDVYTEAAVTVPNIRSNDVDVLPASAWPEPDGDGDAGIIVAADGGVVLDE